MSYVKSIEPLFYPESNIYNEKIKYADTTHLIILIISDIFKLVKFIYYRKI